MTSVSQTIPIFLYHHRDIEDIYRNYRNKLSNRESGCYTGYTDNLQIRSQKLGGASAFVRVAGKMNGTSILVQAGDSRLLLPYRIVFPETTRRDFSNSNYLIPHVFHILLSTGSFFAIIE